MGAEVRLVGDVGKGESTATSVLFGMFLIREPEVTLCINSRGGDVVEGLAIYSGLRQHPARVTIRVEGVAGSIASVIAMAGDRVVMAPSARMMVHSVTVDVPGGADGRHRDQRLREAYSDCLSAIYAERAGGTAAQWRERMEAETWYSAEEAVAAGLAHEVGVR